MNNETQPATARNSHTHTHTHTTGAVPSNSHLAQFRATGWPPTGWEKRTDTFQFFLVFFNPDYLLDLGIFFSLF